MTEASWEDHDPADKLARALLAMIERMDKASFPSPPLLPDLSQMVFNGPTESDLAEMERARAIPLVCHIAASLAAAAVTAGLLDITSDDAAAEAWGLYNAVKRGSSERVTVKAEAPPPGGTWEAERPESNTLSP